MNKTIYFIAIFVTLNLCVHSIHLGSATHAELDAQAELEALRAQQSKF
jgi:hypothetical protein